MGQSAVASEAPARKLYNKDFLLLWLGMAQSAVGNAFFVVAVSYLILHLTGSSTYIGIAWAARSVPYIFGPLAGTLVDRFKMKWVLVFGDTMRFLIMFTFYGLSKLHELNVYYIVFLMFLTGCIGVFYAPTFASVLPQLVSSNDISRANALNSMTGNISQLLGYFCGGLFVSWIGTIPAILLNGATFIIMAGALTFIAFPKVVHHQRGQRIFESLMEGFRYLWVNKFLLAVPIIFFLLSATTSPLEILMPIQMNHIGFGAKGYGFFFGVLFLGSFTTDLLLSKIRVGDQFKRLVGLGLLLITLSLTGISLTQLLPVYLICAVFAGAGISLVAVNLFSHVQTVIEAKQRGRVFGSFGTVENMGMPLATLLIGLSSRLWTFDAILMVSAAAMLLVTLLWATYISRPNVLQS